MTITANAAQLQLPPGLYQFLRGLLEYLAAYTQGQLGTGSIFINIDWAGYYWGATERLSWSGTYGQCYDNVRRCDIYDPKQAFMQTRYKWETRTWPWSDKGNAWTLDVIERMKNADRRP